MVRHRRRLCIDLSSLILLPTNMLDTYHASDGHRNHSMNHHERLDIILRLSGPFTYLCILLIPFVCLSTAPLSDMIPQIPKAPLTSRQHLCSWIVCHFRMVASPSTACFASIAGSCYSHDMLCGILTFDACCRSVRNYRWPGSGSKGKCAWSVT